MTERTRNARRTVVDTRRGLWSDASRASWRWRTRAAWWSVLSVEGDRSEEMRWTYRPSRRRQG